MWTIFAEQPLLIAIMIAVVVVGLVYAWMQTGDRRVAIAAVVTALLIPGAYFLADRIVTDREKILDAIQQTAAAIEHNDHVGAVEFVLDSTTRQRALAELPRYEFQRARARNIQINMVTGSLPPEATVDLDASVRVSMNGGGVRDYPGVARLILTFQQQPDGSWGVTDYSYRPITGGADNLTPNGN